MSPIRCISLLLLLAAPACGRTAALTELSEKGRGAAAPDMRPLCADDPGVESPRRTTRFDLGVSVPGGLGRLQVTVFGPSDSGDTLATSGAPFPGVVLAPAYRVQRNQYFDYAYRLANHGMVVLVVSPRSESDQKQSRADLVALLDWLADPTGVDAEKLLGRVDIRRIGLTGHGVGGKLAFLAAQSEPQRARAVLGIDPVDSQGSLPDNPSALPGMPQIRARSGLLGETLSAQITPSCTPPGENFAAFYDRLPAPAFAIVFRTAGHMDFIDDLSTCVECTRCGAGAPDRRTVHQLAVKYVTAFFQVHLQGCATAEAYLTGAKFEKDRDTGLVELRQKM
jgi:predicted dienelactone hydrolase